MSFSLRPASAVLCLLALSLSAGICDGDTGGATGGPTGTDAVVTCDDAGAAASAAEVDIYVDATTSMEGYVGAETEYAEFLRSLEASLISKWGQSDVRFFKFGSRVDSTSRDAFLSARDDLAFYRQRGVFEVTSIDSVLARTAPGRVSVVVTDLFQDAGDTNALVDQVKTRVFARGLAAGVIAVESRFDGTVYDAPGGAYRYASTPGDPATYRPFYVLAFGEPAEVDRLFEALASTSGVREDRTLKVSPCVVDAFELELAKAPGDASRGINVGAVEDGQYRFVVRDDADGGVLNGTLRLDPAPGAAAVDPDRVEIAAWRWGGGQDSVATRDLEVSDVRAQGDALTFDLTLDMSEPPGRYTYLVLFQAAAVDGLAPPPWVDALSTTAPTASADPNKTLNLGRLMGDLVQASATVERPLLGRAVFSVTKQ